MVLEIGKSYVFKFYGGNSAAAKKAKDGVLWTPEKIKAAFNNGNGTIDHFKRYMNDNKKHAWFLEV